MVKKPESTIDESWMTTYSDMVTLLLCFFVLMLAASSPDVARYEQIRSGMNESLGNKSINKPIEMMVVELTEDIQSMNAEEGISLGTDTRGVVIEFTDAVLFDYGSAELKKEALPALKRLAATLKSERYNNFNFSIEGHTSDDKFSNPQFPSNWELSSARASSVASFLEERGIPRVRLKVTGMYDISPKYPNHDPFGEPIPQNRRKNRRVVIHVEPHFN
ncbi:MAG: flagellar motor protein MotB [Lactobacillus sp.]|jgi:chemotaxis protein MotB|nr:flagellar motor protein MotB [Lactobacillus sp.]